MPPIVCHDLPMDDRGFRVRPPVAHALARARHVLLDLDGPCFALPRTASPRSLLDGLRPLPAYWSIPAYSNPHVLAYLTHHEPDLAPAAEAAASAREWESILTARPAAGLADLLAAPTGRRMWVVGEHSEDAMRAGLRAHGLDVAVVAGRQGLDPGTFGLLPAAARAIRLLGVDPAECVLVSGRVDQLYHAKDAGMTLLGVVSGHDTRKWLADPAPVLSNLTRLRQALLSTPLTG